MSGVTHFNVFRTALDRLSFYQVLWEGAEEGEEACICFKQGSQLHSADSYRPWGTGNENLGEKKGVDDSLLMPQ